MSVQKEEPSLLDHSAVTKHQNRGKESSESMEESTIDDPEDTKSNGDSDLITEQESAVVVRFDIGRFVLCHRKLCQLTEPFVKCHESYNFITRWQSPRLSVVVMTGSVYLSIRYPVYLLLLPLLYSVVILSLAAVKRLGSKNLRGAVNSRIRNLVKKKEDDYASLELKQAAKKQAHMDLHAFINICVQIQTYEDRFCKYLDKFYRICKWEDSYHSKMCLFALLLTSFMLVLFPGRYLITVGIIAVFTGNSGFQQVFRRTVMQTKLKIQQLKIGIYSHGYWSRQVNGLSRSYQKFGTDAQENDYDDEWYDAEQETSQSESDCSEDENYVEEDEDTPRTKRRASLFSGLSMVTHFSAYRKKQKRINSGNCASCDVSFSSLLKKRQYCRHCGDSFCSRCCSKRVKRAVFGATAPAAYEETVLVCKSCYGYLMNKADEMKTDIW